MFSMISLFLISFINCLCSVFNMTIVAMYRTNKLFLNLNLSKFKYILKPNLVFERISNISFNLYVLNISELTDSLIVAKI